MIRLIRSTGTTAAAMLVATILLAGCESSGDGNAAADTADRGTSDVVAQGQDQAVTCEKCKVTWVKVPDTGGKGRVVAYKTRRSHECPDCRSAVNNFFTTGRMEHTCKTCGDDALQVCEAHAR
jgi:ribosomal protein L37AE/L43A